MKHNFYRKILKRVIDIAASLFALVLLSPVMLAVFVLIKLESDGPAIFRQERIGRNGKVFIMYKFRSMCMDAEQMGTGVYSDDDDFRVTKVGKFIRATSIDELPQLWNVLRGDMSFIGPRPPLTYHPWNYDEYTEEQKRMFEVRPGLTGWAQVNGRREVEWNERIRLNIWYIDHMSLWLDIRIIFKTFFQVLENKNNANIGETVVSGSQAQEAEEPVLK